MYAYMYMHVSVYTYICMCLCIYICTDMTFERAAQEDLAVPGRSVLRDAPGPCRLAGPM